MAANRLGPEVRGDTTRPGPIAPTSVDTWFVDCVGSDPTTGTALEQSFFNRLLANFRSLFTQSNLATGDDNMLRDGVALQTLGNQMAYVLATGTATALVATLAPVPLNGYQTGMRFSIKLPVNIGSGATCNLNSLGAKAIVYPDASAVVVNDYLTGGIIVLEYDGTNLQVQNPSIQLINRLAKTARRTIISATGAYTFTVPAGVTVVKAKAWAGAGGGGFGFAGSPSGGGVGGGGGAYFEKTLAVTPGDSITGSVGISGANGTSGGSNGGTGGDSTVIYAATTYTAGGGTGGTGATAGTCPNSVSGGSVTGSVDFARTGQPGLGGFLTGSSPTIAGNGGASGQNGGYGGAAGTGSGNGGAVPGGGGAGSANSQTAGAGGRGEVWFEY